MFNSHQFIRRFIFLKPLLIWLALLSFTVLIYLFINMDITTQNRYAMPSLLFGTWCLLLNLLLSIVLFSPEHVLKKPSWLARIKLRIAKSLFTFLNVIFICISLVLIYLTVKMFNIWLTL
jgi:hypothetical protein